LRLLSIAALVAVATPGCEPGQTDVVGRWQATGEAAGEFVEFKDDGVVRGKDCNEGTYRYVDAGRVRIDFDGDSVIVGVSISGDVLTMSMEDGSFELVRGTDEADRVFDACDRTDQE